MKKNPLPKTMLAVRIHAFDGKPGSLKVDEVPVPKPKPGQVLVKMTTASINPSDLLYLRGEYGFTRPVPTTPGFVGAGIVVDAAPGFFGKLLMGKRVACAGEEDYGTWAEYCCANAMQSVKLSNKINDEQGSMLLVNPITAMAMLHDARSKKHKAAINTAAASAVGKLLNKFASKVKYPIINIVRWETEAEELKALGAKYILNSSDPDFIKQLTELSQKLQATIAFDAVSGELPGQLIDAMPARSQVYIYGRLSPAPMQIDPWKLLFQNKSVHGFWFSDWVEENGMLQTVSVLRKVVKAFDSGLTSHVAARFPLSKVHEAVDFYEKNMKDNKAAPGKVVLVPA